MSEKETEDGIYVIPNPLERMLTNWPHKLKCPFDNYGICTHPLTPFKDTEKRRKQIVDEVKKRGIYSFKLDSCSLKDAKKCPLLKVMPLIDFNLLNLEEVQDE